MKILGIDTTTKFLSLGVYDNGKICEYNIDLGKKYSSLLTITIKRVIETLGWEFDDIDYFACGLGPGSFTGVRVGLATIKGLSLALKKPILGISTLDILAKNVNPGLSYDATSLNCRKGGVNNSDRYIVPAIDAKRNLIYCSIYTNKDGRFKRKAPYMLLTISEFFRKIKPKSIIFGDVLSIYKENIIKNVKGIILLDQDYWYPKGRNIIALTLEKIKDKKFSNTFAIEPIYLYPKECQIKKNSV